MAISLLAIGAGVVAAGLAKSGQKAAAAGADADVDHDLSANTGTGTATKMKFLPRTKKIQGIVVHHTHTATAEATKRVLEKRGFSTNFEVDKKGHITMYADPTKWEAQATGGGANAHTIGIDVTHVGLSEPFPPAQMQALRALIHKLAQTYGFPVKVAPDGQRGKWVDWAGKGYTVFRHRNFVNTACPANLPLEEVG